MNAETHGVPDIEPFPFTSREFVVDTFPTLRTAWLFGGADQPTLEGWLRELAATPEGLTAIFDIIRAMRAVGRRFTEIGAMLDATSDLLDGALVVTGIVKAA